MMQSNKPLDTLEHELLSEITSLNDRLDANKATMTIMGVICSLLFMFAAVSVSIIIYLLLWGPR